MVCCTSQVLKQAVYIPLECFKSLTGKYRCRLKSHKRALNDFYYKFSIRYMSISKLNWTIIELRNGYSRFINSDPIVERPDVHCTPYVVRKYLFNYYLLFFFFR